jgi:hypothetical protein
MLDTLMGVEGIDNMLFILPGGNILDHLKDRFRRSDNERIG